IAFNQHFEGDGMIVFQHACALGCEGIVSKQLGSHYRSGRVDHWLKVTNPAAPAVSGRPKKIGRQTVGARAPMVTEPRRHFSPPWSIAEYNDACFIVRDHKGQALAYVYFEEEPGRRAAANLVTKDEARRIAVNVAKLPDLLRKE